MPQSSMVPIMIGPLYLSSKIPTASNAIIVMQTTSTPSLQRHKSRMEALFSSTNRRTNTVEPLRTCLSFQIRCILATSRIRLVVLALSYLLSLTMPLHKVTLLLATSQLWIFTAMTGILSDLTVLTRTLGLIMLFLRLGETCIFSRALPLLTPLSRQVNPFV